MPGMENLAPERTDYFFTDVSATMIGRAEARFKNFSFVRFRALDIEHDPIEQGMTGEQFDVAIPAFSLDSPHQGGGVH